MKINIFLCGDLQDNSSISEKIKTLIRVYVDESELNLYIHNLSEKTVKLPENTFKARTDIDYDIGIYAAVLSHHFNDRIREPFFKYKCLIRYCYPIYDGTVPPKEWINIINSEFDGALVHSYHVGKTFTNNGCIKPYIPVGLILDNDNYLKYKKKLNSKIFSFGFIGALEQRKNPIKIVKAFSNLFHNREDVQLLIHSSYSFEEQYLEEFKKILLADNIKFSFRNLEIKELEKLHKKIDCYVYPSKAEGYSITPRDALAVGSCLILSDIGVHKELVHNLTKQDGVLFVNANIPEPIKHYSLHKRYLGVQFDCQVSDLEAKMLYMYQNAKKVMSKESILKRKEVAKKYNISNMKRYFLSLVKPKRIKYESTDRTSVLEDGTFICNDCNLYEKYNLILNKIDYQDFSKLDKFVLELNDAGLFSLLNQFVSHLTYKKFVIPNWRANYLLKNLQKKRSYNDFNLPFEGLCYYDKKDANFFLDLFEKLPFANDNFMYNSDIMYENSQVIDRYDYNYESLPNLTYKDAYYLYKDKNFDKIRKNINFTIKNNIILKQDILDDISNFYNKYLKKHPIISVHIRHPNWIEQVDKHPIKFSNYKNEIDKVIKLTNSDKWRIFLATDDNYFLNKFKKQYKQRLLYQENIARGKYNEKLSENIQIQYLMSNNNNNSSKWAKEVLVDAYLLARGQYLIAMVSNITTYVCFLNPQIKLILAEDEK